MELSLTIVDAGGLKCVVCGLKGDQRLEDC